MKLITKLNSKASCHFFNSKASCYFWIVQNWWINTSVSQPGIREPLETQEISSEISKHLGKKLIQLFICKRKKIRIITPITSSGVIQKFQIIFSGLQWFAKKLFYTKNPWNIFHLCKGSSEHKRLINTALHQPHRGLIRLHNCKVDVANYMQPLDKPNFHISPI